MIPGPVFNFELLTTARRGRFYAVRGAYAFVLLLIFWIIHVDWSADRGGTLTVKQVGAFALVCFCGVSLGQMLLVLTLTPALVAGVIADEKQRKTLHYLLASRLSGPEIVIGKLLARMLHVGVLLAVSVPVLSMLVLLGGIDPMVILLACGAAASSAWFLAALSIWVSTIARRVREALFVAYGLEFLWLFFPFIFRQSPSVGWPLADRILNEAIDWLAASSPAELVRELIYMLQSGSTTFLSSVVVMIEIAACRRPCAGGAGGLASAAGLPRPGGGRRAPARVARTLVGPQEHAGLASSQARRSAHALEGTVHLARPRPHAVGRGVAQPGRGRVSALLDHLVRRDGISGNAR